MSNLYTAYQIRGLTLPNRIVVSPMCQYSATNGLANDWHLVHLGSRAVGGAGLVFTEAAAISPEGRISPGDLGIWSKEHKKALKRIVKFIKQQGSAAGIQLAHAGRKASTKPPWEGGTKITPQNGGWTEDAPSPISFNEGDAEPKALTIAEIKEVVSDFASAAKRAVKAGFDVIEIHAAHGYLINQFLSPLTNKRQDAYGGTFENRVHLLQEVCNAIRAIIPEEMPLFVRISASEWAEGGHTIDDSIEVAKVLKTLGVDLIDCSSGGVVKEQDIKVEKNYQAPFADAIKAQADIATGAVGMITDAQQAEMILNENKADLIFMAREFLRNPYFPLLEAKNVGETIKWPNQYERGKPRD
ncbi:MAG TPA: NADPH dehydrogenase NamA [Leeuwenhoekiella sp.]|nr:NADPH dehydrogenase NamA [Leeuwenhoekiella sp.]